MHTFSIIEKPAFRLTGKSQKFEFHKFGKEGPKFWKDYTASDEYNALWQLTGGRSGAITEAPIMSAYFPDDSYGRDTFTDVLALETSPDIASDKFETFSVPAARYAEFTCVWQTSMKTNKWIYGEWLPSSGFDRDGTKPDIAAYFPIAFRPLKDTQVRWWIPVKPKQN